MTNLKWDKTGDYETGLDRGVYFPRVGPGVAWDGLISVEDATERSGYEIVYVDGVKVLGRRRRGEFAGRIEAYAYPAVSESFGFSYRVRTAKGYRIHLVYNALLTPIATTREQLGPSTLSASFTTLPTEIPTSSPGSHLFVDTGVAYSWTVAAVERILYGDEFSDSRLPSPAEILTIFEENSIVRVFDHGDGSFSVDGPDSAVYMLDSTSFAVNWPSAVYIDSDTYTIHSL